MKSRVHPKYKTKYRVKNWSTCDRALVRRGDVTVWLSPEAIATWKPASAGKPGGQLKYSDRAIETALTLRLIFNLPLHQTDDLLRKRGKISESLVTQMTSWRHSGFSVHLGAKIDAADVAGRERLAQYMLRCPFSLERMIRVTDQGTVLYLAEKNTPQRLPHPATADLFGGSPGVARNFQVLEPLDFIAELTQHIPEPRKHLVRYFGFYSSKSRGLRARAAPDHDETDPRHTPTARTARRRWAALIQQVWQVDPLECPRCGHRLQIISFIQPTQRHVIDKILTHCGLSTRAPPVGVQRPPAAPPIRQLTYVSDLEFVQDPGPPQPVWAAH